MLVFVVGFYYILYEAYNLLTKTSHNVIGNLILFNSNLDMGNE